MGVQQYQAKMLSDLNQEACAQCPTSTAQCYTTCNFSFLSDLVQLIQLVLIFQCISLKQFQT